MQILQIAVIIVLSTAVGTEYAPSRDSISNHGTIKDAKRGLRHSARVVLPRSRRSSTVGEPRLAPILAVGSPPAVAEQLVAQQLALLDADDLWSEDVGIVIRTYFAREVAPVADIVGSPRNLKSHNRG